MWPSYVQGEMANRVSLITPSGCPAAEVVIATSRRRRPRGVLGRAALLGLVVAVAAVAAASAGTGRKKNVLLIVADSLGPVIEPYGHGEAAATPNLAAFAVNATVFTRAFAQSPGRAASRISMLTGRYPSTTGIHAPGMRFRQQLQSSLGPYAVLSLPEWFRDKQGYTTRVVGEVFPTQGGMSSELPGCTSASEPLDGCQDDGASWSEESEVPSGGKSAQCLACLDNESPPSSQLAWAATQCDANCMDDSWTANRAAALIDSLQLDRENSEIVSISRPWFLAVGLKLPGFPIIAPQADFDVLATQGLPLSDGIPLGPPLNPGWPQETSLYARSGNRNIREFDDVTATSSNGSALDGLVLGSTSDELRKAYHAALHFVDAKIGTLLDTLAARGSGAVEDTVVVVVGDRGASRGDNGAWGGEVVFDSALRTVMMIRNGSGWTPARATAPRTGNNTGINGAQSDAMAGLVDVWPTLAELAVPNASVPSDLEGISLAAAIAAPLLDETQGAEQGRGIGDVVIPRPNLPKLAQPEGHRQAAFAMFPRDPACSADPDTSCVRSGDPSLWSPPNGPRMGVTVRCATGWLFTEWTRFDFNLRRPVWSPLGEESSTLDMYDLRLDTGAVPGLFGGDSVAKFPAMLGVRQRLRILLREGFDGAHVFEVGLPNSISIGFCLGNFDGQPVGVAHLVTLRDCPRDAIGDAGGNRDTVRQRDGHSFVQPGRVAVGDSQQLQLAVHQRNGHHHVQFVTLAFKLGMPDALCNRVAQLRRVVDVLRDGIRLPVGGCKPLYVAHTNVIGQCDGNGVAHHVAHHHACPVRVVVAIVEHQPVAFGTQRPAIALPLRSSLCNSICGRHRVRQPLRELID